MTALEGPTTSDWPRAEPLLLALSWYAIYTRCNCERQVETRLEDAGIEHWSPFVPAVKHPGRKPHPWARTENPLLPGYVFGRLDLREDEHNHRISVLSIPGVVRLVGFGLEPVAIPDTEVESLRILISSGITVSSVPLVKEGDYVRVVHGPFAGAEGYLVYVGAGKSKIPCLMVSITMLGRSHSVPIAPDCLERSNPPASTR